MKIVLKKTWLILNQSYNMAKEKPRILYRGDEDFTRYLFPILTTFDHMFWPFRQTEYTEHTD